MGSDPVVGAARDAGRLEGARLRKREGGARARHDVEVVGPAARVGGRRRVPDVEALRRQAQLTGEGPLHAVDVHADGLYTDWYV